MTKPPNLAAMMDRELLLAHGWQAVGPHWLHAVDAALRPSGFTVYRAHTGAETIERVERGGLAAAVLIADQRHIDGLSLIRIIRSIDRELPCWLVTQDTTKWTLQTALSLSVRSVITHPVELSELTLALRRLLAN